MQGLEDLLAPTLFKVNSILVGEFRLSSGGVSHIYVDMRRVIGHPWAFRLITSLIAAEFGDELRGSVIVGVATGGIPWATALSLTLNTPLAYVRPRKGHGTERTIEGAEVKGLKAVVVDDVATTGSSLLGAVEELRAAGAFVESALVIVDRLQGARERLASAGVRLLSLVTLKGLLSSAVRQGLMTEEQMREIEVELWGEQR